MRSPDAVGGGSFLSFGVVGGGDTECGVPWLAGRESESSGVAGNVGTGAGDDEEPMK